MNSKLNNKQQKIVLDNRDLVNYLINKHNLTGNQYDIEDFTSIGTIGLIKAAITFDESKDIAFSTYASRCILNEIYYFCRRANKYESNVSLYDTIAEDKIGNKLTLLDIIEDPKSDFTTKLENVMDFIEQINIVLNCLSQKQRFVLLCTIGGKSQRDIATRLTASQSWVSRIELKAIQKVRVKAAQKSRSNLGKFGEYKKVYSIGIEEYKYKLTFSSKDVCECDDLLWQTLKEMADEFYFKVKRDKEQITICTPADQEFFCIIAEVIWRIEDLSM